MFVWHRPQSFVNSVRGGIMKNWKREKQEEELQKNMKHDVNSRYSSFHLDSLFFFEIKRILSSLYPCTGTITT